VAKRLGISRQGNLPVRELRDYRVPRATTIIKHAKALGCEPWELLDGVETEYDKLRRKTTTGNPATPRHRPAV